MPEAISNTSPLLYLHRIGALGWLPQLFSEVWIPTAVFSELAEGQQRGYDVPVPSNYPWLQVNRLSDTGMWLSGELRQRILVLAGESPP